MEARTRRLVVTLIMIIAALGSIFTMKLTADTYMEVAKAESLMKAKLVGLDVVGNTVILTFRLNNESVLDLDLINIQFNMYANREYVGNYDMRERTPLKTGETEVEIRIELIDRYVRTITGEDYTTLESFLQSGSGSIQWFLTGAAVVELPFGEFESYNVSVREQWVSA
ncbi:MAG: hypothetical protein HXS46_17635 [Theionarchaea archaeon]|nr:MAG: hypothetical protein AYK18_06520 [Theionarchaea archaeon DG-70]MBU7012506.1 hypothetical protein [Theionarchaea archaeon]